MRKTFFMAGIAAAALVPAIAHAQDNCERQRSTRVVATVGGAGVGAVLGNVIAGHGDKTLGTIVGAVGGAVLGNQIAKPSGDCNHAYGYYDEQNRWHATGVSAADARGYYDRDGQWVDGAPAGYYDENDRWVGSNTLGGAFDSRGSWAPASANGYYDRDERWIAGPAHGYRHADGRWLPANAQPGNWQGEGAQDRRGDAYGYYDVQGQWHANADASRRSTGYYDRNHNWVTGAPNGHYDSRGNWVPSRDDGSASGSYDAQNRWVPSPAAGYYDDAGQWVAGSASGHYDSRGQWVAGVTTGHYDARGRWIAGEPAGHRDRDGRWIADPQPGYYGTDGRWHAGKIMGYYDSRGRWVNTDMAGDSVQDPILDQVARLERFARSAEGLRSVGWSRSRSVQRELNAIRTSERRMRHDSNGNLSIRDEASLQLRLDQVARRLGVSAS